MKKIILASITLSVCLLSKAGDNGSIPSVCIPSDPEAIVMGTVSSFGNYAFAAENNITSAAFMDKKYSAALSYTMWNVAGQPKHIAGAAAAFKHRKWGFALSAGSYMDGASYSIYDESGAPDGNFLPYNARLSIGAAYTFGPGLSAGLVAKGIYSALHPDYNAFVAAGDIYFSYNASLIGATLALCNLGMPVRYSPGASSFLPMLAKAGVNIRPVDGLQIAVESDYMLNNSSWMFNGGVQYAILGIATIRAGYHYSIGNRPVLPSYATAGVAFHFKGFTIECTYLFANQILKNTFSAGLRCSF